MNFLLKVADLVFTAAAIAALLLARLHPDKVPIWPGIALAIAAAAGFYLLRSAARENRKELMLELGPEDWSVEYQNAIPMHAWLEIPQERHGKGKDVCVHIEQVELKHWEFDEPKIENGKITIRYSHNNFPRDPRIRLRVYVSGRG